MDYLNTYRLFEDKYDDDFDRLIGEVLVELTDNGFLYRVENVKSTYKITITHKGVNKIRRYMGEIEDYRDSSFKWGVVKENIEIMIEYLSDIFPKITFTEFSTDLQKSRHGRGMSGYGSVRSHLGSSNKFFTFKDFSNSLKDEDILHEIKIQCTLRFRGNIKSF